MKMTHNTKCLLRCGASGTLKPWYLELKVLESVWTTVWHFLVSINHDSTVLLLIIYPRERKMFKKDFIGKASSFIKGPNWKQPQCLPIDQIKTVVYS